MLWVKPGTFMMGGHSKFPDLNQRGKERHRVILSQGFYLGKHEVSQAQWKKIMTSNPSQWKGDRLPVEKVNWTQAMKFCTTLTEREGSTGRLPPGWKYTLPTEAQWEYSCRAGTFTLFSFGDTITKNEVNFTRHVRKTTPVRKYPPNQWGFHNMHGNVREWCKDFHGEYPLLSVIDPEGPLNGTKRLARGGAWDNSPPYVESAARGAISGNKGENNIGFRLALTKSN
jgi:formylglycine-generating enzyme